jgi:hypothetical protein
MRGSWLVLVVTVYVSLDVANPLMPGALTFGIEDSVEVRQAERFRGHDEVALASAFLLSAVTEETERRVMVSRGPVADVPRIWSPHVQRAHSSLSTPPSSSEDH